MTTQKRLRKLLRYNPCEGIFTWKRSQGRTYMGSVAGYKAKDGYLRIGIDGEIYLGHILAWLYTYGEIPRHPQVIDHLNGKKGDNSIWNLRLTNQSENMTAYYWNKQKGVYET